MSSGCGDVLNLEDLKTAKKHQVFEAEVITGKAGGVASGADIDYSTNQVTGQAQKTMPAILRDIGFDTAGFDFTTGGTLTVNDRNKAVLWPMASGGDGGYYVWEGALPKVIPATATPASSGGVAPGAWKNVTDQVLRTDLAAPDGAKLIGESSNIASLRALEPTYAGQRILLKEHTTGVGKGGGEFRAVMDSTGLQDNNGTVVTTTGGKAWLRVFNVATPFMFGAVGDWDPVNKVGTDDTNSFKNAMAALKLLGGGSLHIPAGDYLVRAVEIPSNVYIYGDGWATSLWQVEEPWSSTVVCLGTNISNMNRPDFSLNTTDVVIENLAFRRKNRDAHTSGSDVAQFRHLLSINATTRFYIGGCLFEGFNGDGIYVAGGVGTNEGHNFYGRINNCTFEGIDLQNRNGVSVIDCEGLEICHSFFRAVSNQFQPGPIDIEPNANTFHRIRDININNCRFVACGGGSAGLTVAIPDVAYGVRPTGITFKDNIIDGATHATAKSAFRVLWGGASLADQNLDMVVSGNKITRCQRPFDISGTTNLRILNNTFWDITNPAIFGTIDTNRRCKGTTIRGNVFRDIGADEGACFAIYAVEDLIIDSNVFRNIGKTSAPASGEVIIFKSGSTGTSIRITENTFFNGGSTITSAISSTAYNFTVDSNEFRDNLYLGGGGLSNRNFPALYGNEGEVNYNPTVYGDTVEGAGTYTVRNGRYHIEGSVVHYRLNVTLSAHSGSGPMNVTLPTKCAVNGATAPMTAWVSGNIASAIGIAAARIDGGVFNNTGRARLYRADGAGNININSAGSALGVEIAGTYHLDAS